MFYFTTHLLPSDDRNAQGASLGLDVRFTNLKPISTKNDLNITQGVGTHQLHPTHVFSFH